MKVKITVHIPYSVKEFHNGHFCSYDGRTFDKSLMKTKRNRK